MKIPQTKVDVSDCGVAQASVVTKLGHPEHIWSGSSESDPLKNISRSDLDWIT